MADFKVIDDLGSRILKRESATHDLCSNIDKSEQFLSHVQYIMSFMFVMGCMFYFRKWELI